MKLWICKLSDCTFFWLIRYNNFWMIVLIFLPIFWLPNFLDNDYERFMPWHIWNLFGNWVFICIKAWKTYDSFFCPGGEEFCPSLNDVFTVWAWVAMKNAQSLKKEWRIFLWKIETWKLGDARYLAPSNKVRLQTSGCLWVLYSNEKHTASWWKNDFFTSCYVNSYITIYIILKSN